MVAIAALTIFSAHAQEKLPEVYLNHIFIVLDSNSYNHLFDSSFISDTLGDIKESAHKTTSDSWSGKYLYGKNGYFEFFSTKSYVGATINDCGLGFMTFKSDDILKIEQYWKKNTSDNIEKDTIYYVFENKSKPWFYSLYISRKDSLQPLSTWLMENTPEILKSSGFKDEEIKKEIKWHEYMARVNKKEFMKSFNRIKSIVLSLNQKEYEYFRKTLIGLGMKQKGNTYYNDQINISYTIDDIAPVRLKTVETELTDSLPDDMIRISKNLMVLIKGKKAIWNFTYE